MRKHMFTRHHKCTFEGPCKCNVMLQAVGLLTPPIRPSIVQSIRLSSDGKKKLPEVRVNKVKERNRQADRQRPSLANE